MLKLTRKVEYALIALRYMQRKKLDECSSAKEISQLYNIPLPLLSKILQKLSRAQIIQAIQGPYGGYLLKIQAENLSMKKLINILEGPVGIMDCSIDSECTQLETCNIKNPIHKVNNAIIDVLNKITLADISEQRYIGRQ
tara:strand:+ start:48 stop:467 length:420 start_codon:yes stop_codon:yes gene_type:complete